VPAHKKALSTIHFGQKSNVGGVQPMKVGHMEIAKEINGTHNIVPNDAPTMFVKSSREVVRSRGLATGRRLIGFKTSPLREAITKGVQIRVIKV
jgi:hypothetical protein